MNPPGRSVSAEDSLMVGRWLAAALAFAALPAMAASHMVVIDGTAFAPASMTVQRGDRITWVNKDPFPHTATAKGTFDSGPIAADASWTWVADKTGTFDYVCTLHPTMKARLVVR
jgi:plastocyanin